MILVERLYEPAHVGPLKVVGKVHIKVGNGGGLLKTLVFVEHGHRVAHAFNANFLKRSFSCVKFVLDVSHISHAKRESLYASVFSAASSVLYISIAIVMGPTPPGTGVM